MKTTPIFSSVLGLILIAPLPLRAEDKPAGQVSEAKLERIREANKRKAREQMARDSQEYKRDEFAALEELYQKANANPRTPENQVRP